MLCIPSETDRGKFGVRDMNPEAARLNFALRLRYARKLILLAQRLCSQSLVEIVGFPGVAFDADCPAILKAIVM